MSIIERLIKQHGCIDKENFEDVVEQLTKRERKQLAKELMEQREMIVSWFGGEHNMKWKQ
jgi:hypothetical protein